MYPPMIHQPTLQSWKIIESQSEKHSNAITHPNKHLFSYLFPLQHVISAVWSGAFRSWAKIHNPPIPSEAIRNDGAGGKRGRPTGIFLDITYPNRSRWGDTQRTTPTSCSSTTNHGNLRTSCICPRRNTCLFEGIGDRWSWFWAP